MADQKMTEQEVAREIDKLQKMKPEERLAWFQANQSKLSGESLNTISMIFETDYQFTAAIEAVASAPGKAVKDAAAKKDQTSRVQARASELEQLGQNPTQSKIQATDEENQKHPDKPINPEDVFGKTRLPSPVVNALGGLDATPEQEQAAVDFINDTRNTSYSSITEMVDDGLFQDPLVTKTISMFLDDSEPEAGIEVKLASGRNEFIGANLAQTAEDVWGLDKVGLARTVTIADNFGFKRMDGGTAWQPMAALFSAAGYRNYGQTADDDKKSKEQLASLLAKRKTLAEQEMGLPGNAVIGKEAKKLDDQIAVLRGKIQETAAGPQSQKNPLWTPLYLRAKYEEGIRTYQGDDRLALIHVFDPQLATKIKGAGGDPTKLDWKDGEKLGSLVRSAGFSDPDEFASAMTQFGYGEAGGNDMLTQLLKSLKAAQEDLAGGAGAKRMQADPVAVKQSVKDLYRQLYMEDPDEATLERMTGAVAGAINGAPEDQSVNGEARVRQEVEGSSKYKELYGNKPTGMTEEEYQNQFRNAQGSMLGSEAADNQAARLGMKSGQYQTTVGAAAGLKEAWDNSTFLGRLAEAAQTVGRNT